MARRYAPAVEAAIARAAQQYGIPESRLRAFVGIESGGNPLTTTGSYRGLLQLSDDQFAKYGGGQGNVYSIDDNLRAGAGKLKDMAGRFQRQYGRDPTDAELYLMHQQGEGGAAMHWKNPDRPAWQNMAETGEGRQKGEAWAKRAIWGNVPDDVKKQFGSVDNLTSRQFAELWAGKVGRFGGDGTMPTTMVADASPAPSQSPSSAVSPIPPVATAQAQTPASDQPAPFSIASALKGIGIDTGASGAAAANQTWASALGGNLSIGGMGGGTPASDAMKAAQAEDVEAPAPPPIQFAGNRRLDDDLKRIMAVLSSRTQLG